MAHRGRPYPWVYQYDTWLFTTAPRAQLAEKYKTRIRAEYSSLTIPCTNAGVIESEAFVRDPTTGYVSWKFVWPCTPPRHAELRMILKTDMRDWRWQWLLYNNGVETNRSIELPPANSYGDPNTVSNTQWVNSTFTNGQIIFLTSPTFVPWPP